MGRQQYNDGQELIFADFNKLQARNQQELYDAVLFKMLQETEDAVFDTSFLVSFVSSTQISINPGTGFQTDATVDSSEPQKRLLFRAAAVPLSIAAPDASLDRIDIVVMQHARVDGLTESRKFKAAGTGIISNQNLVVTNEWEATFQIVAGTPDASPVAPAIPAGFLKIAELAVTAVSGMSGAGALTDTRTQMPLAGGTTLNTLGKLRVTAGASVSLNQLITDIDALLVSGLQTFTDYVDQVATDPAAPAAGNKRVYFKGDTMFFREEGGAVNPIGGGGGGGGSAAWHGDTNAPVEDTEFSEKVFKYPAGGNQSLFLYLKVPQGFIAGRQILAFLGQYSPSASNTQLLSVVSTLIRKNNDDISSAANQHSSTNTAITNTVANQYREVQVDVTDGLGLINGVQVQLGDLIKLELTRGSDTDTADIRFAPGATEVKFA